MTRRPARPRSPLARRVVAVVAGALTFAACATFENSHRVAEVNGQELSEGMLADMLDSPLGATLMGSAPVEGVAPGDSTRGLISAWIALNALEDAGFVDEEGRTSASEQASAEFGDDWNSAPEELRNLLIINGAVNEKIQSGETSEAEVEKVFADADVVVSPRYGRWSPADGGVLPLG